MRAALIALVVALLFAAGIVVGILSVEWDKPECFEDSVWVWDEDTNAHTNCVPLDDLEL